MFNLFKKRPSAAPAEKPMWLDLFDTQPTDCDGSLIALDDLVEYRGRTMQVVAMSHKRKVALRVPGQTRGAYWAHAERCQLVKRHGSINRETKGN